MGEQVVTWAWGAAIGSGIAGPPGLAGELGLPGARPGWKGRGLEGMPGVWPERWGVVWVDGAGQMGIIGWRGVVWLMGHGLWSCASSRSGWELDWMDMA